MAGNKIRLLLGVSDPADVELTQASLRKLNLPSEVETSERAEALIDRLRSGEVDLVVLDYELPKEAAVRTLDSARGIPEAPPIIVISRHDSEALAIEIFRRGATDYLCRSPDFEKAFPLVLRETIDRSRAQMARRTGELEIRYLKEFNENIIQNINSALLVVDLLGRIVFGNRMASKITSYGDRELVRLTIDDLFPGEKAVPPHLWQTVRSGLTFRGSETSLIAKDDQRIPIGISTSVLRDSRGEKIGAIGIFLDLTEIQRLRLQLLQAEKMASIGHLVAGIAHEINNPMGFIHSNLFRISEYVEQMKTLIGRFVQMDSALARGDHVSLRAARAELDSLKKMIDLEFIMRDIGKAVRESQEGAERVTRIIQDLLEFSHIDTGEQELADINRCIEGTVNLVWNTLKHRVQVVRGYGALPLVHSYPRMLEQVFMNLLVNAFQAIDGQGVIYLRTRADERNVWIEIEDTGRGIPTEHLGKVFDPFFTTKEVGIGTGLGLSVSYNIIAKHGGSLAVESEPGRGALFTIRLPLENPASG